MHIKVLASGSSGNCYYLSHGESSLLLECGIRFKEIREGVGFKVSALDGVLVSHEHGDHCKAAVDMMLAGVPLYASRGTLGAIGIEGGHWARSLTALEPVDIGPWRVLPFDAVHDAAEPLGFLIAKGTQKLLYFTDSAYCPYRFTGLTHIMAEANFSLERLRENVQAGSFPLAHKNRVLRNHMSLERLLSMLEANDLSRVEEIWLLHLSRDNADAETFRTAVAAGTGKPVYIAGRKEQTHV